MSLLLPSVRASGLPLAELAAHLPSGVTLHGDGAVRVTGVRHDSREVELGDLFVVRKGGASDGAQYVGEALQRGAVALVHERGCPLALLRQARGDRERPAHSPTRPVGS